MVCQIPAFARPQPSDARLAKQRQFAANRATPEGIPQVDWEDKEWASWYGDRAEAFNTKGELPAGPSVHQQGRVLLAWPAKLTLVPALSDCVLEHFKDIAPSAKSPPPPLPSAGIGSYPWELAAWQKLF
jgi:hypothetical protein